MAWAPVTPARMAAGKVAARSVREIAKATDVRPIENAQPGVEGTIDLRGSTVPVVDLRPRLGLGLRESPVPEGDLMIVECETGLVALDIDAVTCLMEVPRSAVDPSSDSVWRDREKGILRTPDGLCVIEDLNRALCQLIPAEIASFSGAQVRG